jgi:hypothetical protein
MALTKQHFATVVLGSVIKKLRGVKNIALVI